MTQTLAAEISVEKNSVGRTYAVPKNVAATVASALPKYQSFLVPGSSDERLVQQLFTFGRLHIQDVGFMFRKHNILHNDPDQRRLYGGEPGFDWAQRIVQNHVEDAEKQWDVLLASIGYDTDRYSYFGLSSPADGSRMEIFGRLPLDSNAITDLDILDPLGNWKKTTDHVNRRARAFNRDMAALMASAVMDFHSAVLLRAGYPLCFLADIPEVPLRAAATDDAGAHYYAIVDPTDTTAVVNLIKIEPGPQVWVRNGGVWAPNPQVFAALMSTSPPPLVELTGETLTSVTEQVDASGSQQVAPDGQGGAATGQALQQPEEEDSNASSNGSTSGNTANSKPNSQPTSTVAASAAMVAAMELRRSYEISGLGFPGAQDVREQTLRSSVILADALRRRQADLENIIIPARTPVPDNRDNSPRALQRRFESLDRMSNFWLVNNDSMVTIRWDAEGESCGS